MKYSEKFSRVWFIRSKLGVLAIISLAIVALLFDTTVIKIYSLSFSELDLKTKYIIFICIGAVSIFCQFFIYKYARNKSSEIRRINLLNVNRIHTLILALQAITTISFLSIVVQMLTSGAYDIHILMISVAITCGGGIFLLVLLSLRFISWFISSKNFVLLLYGLSFLSVSINVFFTGFLVFSSLINKPALVFPHYGFVASPFTLDYEQLLTDGYTYSMILGFIFSWTSTVFLLRQFSIKWKGKAHWILLVLPAAYFLIQFSPDFTRMVFYYVQSDPVFFQIFYALFVTYGRPIGGFIFGAAFLAISRNLSAKNVSLEYTTFSAYGYIFLFISNQGFMLSSSPYPPFGLATVNFILVSSYLLLVGMFASAISLSQDIKLRTAIRKAVERKSNLLNSIAISQLAADIQKETTEVYSKTRDKTYDQIGIEPTMSLTDAKNYCNEVFNELKKSSSNNK